MKKIKYPRLTLVKEAQDFYKKSTRYLLNFLKYKEIAEHTLLMDWKI